MERINKVLSYYKNLSVEKKAGIWALIAGVAQKGIGVIVTPIFTRILNTTEFAQYTIYQSWHDIFIIFATLNVYYYCSYTAFSKYDDDKDEFIISAQSLMSILAVIGGIIFIVFHTFWGRFFHFPNRIGVLMFLDMLFMGTFNLWQARQRYDFKYKALTILSLANGILGPILSFVFIRSLSENIGYGRIYGVVLSNICFGIIIYTINIIRTKKLISTKYWKYILIFCIPLIPHYLSSIILSRFDRLMIEEFCGQSEVAIYSLAYSIASLLTLLNDSIMKVLTPWTYKSLKSESIKNISDTVFKSLICISGVSFAFIAIAPEIVSIFAPQDYHEAIYLIPPLVGSIFYVFVFSLFANIEYYYSETKYVAAASIGAAVTNFVLNYIFIPKYGYVAAAYTTLVSYMMYTLGHYIFMKLVLKKHYNGKRVYDIKKILAISIVFTVIALIMPALYSHAIVRYIVVALLCCGIFAFRKNIYKIMNIAKGEDNND